MVGVGVSFACILLLSLGPQAASSQSCDMKNKPFAKSVDVAEMISGIGCNFDTGKCLCVNDMAACNKFCQDDSCQRIYDARIMDGFCGCQEVEARAHPDAGKTEACSGPKRRSAGQEAVHIPGGSVGKIPKSDQCYYCVTDMAKCEKRFKKTCHWTFNNRLKDGFCGCKKVGYDNLMLAAGQSKEAIDAVEKESGEEGEEAKELHNLKWRWADHKKYGMSMERFQFEDKWNTPADRVALVKELEEKRLDPKAVAKEYETRPVEFAEVDHPEQRRTFADLSKAMNWLTLELNILDRDEL